MAGCVDHLKFIPRDWRKRPNVAAVAATLQWLVTKHVAAFTEAKKDPWREMWDPAAGGYYAQLYSREDLERSLGYLRSNPKGLFRVEFPLFNVSHPYFSLERMLRFDGGIELLSSPRPQVIPYPDLHEWAPYRCAKCNAETPLLSSFQGNDYVCGNCAERAGRERTDFSGLPLFCFAVTFKNCALRGGTWQSRGKEATEPWQDVAAALSEVVGVELIATVYPERSTAENYV